MRNFITDPSAAYMATMAATANNARGFHGANGAGARMAALVAGCEWQGPGSRKGSSVLRGNVLLAPMGLDDKGLYVEERPSSRTLPWQECCDAAMVTKKWFGFLVLLALLTVCTFEAKTNTFTAALQRVVPDPLALKINLSTTQLLRPFGSEWLWAHPLCVEVIDWSLLGFILMETALRVCCIGVHSFGENLCNLLDLFLVAADAALAVLEYVLWVELGARDYSSSSVDEAALSDASRNSTENTTVWRVSQVWETGTEVALDLQTQRWAWWNTTEVKFSE